MLILGLSPVDTVGTVDTVYTIDTVYIIDTVELRTCSTWVTPGAGGGEGARGKRGTRQPSMGAEEDEGG